MVGLRVRQWRDQQSESWLFGWQGGLSPSGADCLTASEKTIGLGQLLWGKGRLYVRRGGLSNSKRTVSAKPGGFYGQVLASRETKGSGASYWINLVSKATYIYLCIQRESTSSIHPALQRRSVVRYLCHLFLSAVCFQFMLVCGWLHACTCLLGGIYVQLHKWVLLLQPSHS